MLANLIESGVVPVVRLTEVFRQAADSRIITNAHRINQGQMPELPPKNSDSDFYFIERNEAEEIAATLVEMVKNRIPAKTRLDAIGDIQVLCPMNRGSLGTREMNARLQEELNPPRAEEPVVERYGWRFRPRDKVIQTQNNYDKEIFNGDIGQIARIDPVEQEVVVRFEQREVTYDFGELDEVSLAYAITIHKSQGSEFPVVVIPLATQQYLLLQRNLVYTGVTRGKRMVLLIGQQKALAIAVRNDRTERRFSGLLPRLKAGANGTDTNVVGRRLTRRYRERLLMALLVSTVARHHLETPLNIAPNHATMPHMRKHFRIIITFLVVTMLVAALTWQIMRPHSPRIREKLSAPGSINTAIPHPPDPATPPKPPSRTLAPMRFRFC